MDLFGEDILDELARLEQAAITADEHSDEPSQEKIHQWQTLFQYSYAQAVEKIKQQYYDLSRRHIADDMWEEIREEKQSQWYDKDAYEHFIEIQQRGELKASEPPPLSQGTASATYLLKLEGQISDSQQVQALLGYTGSLEIEMDDDDLSIRFCRV